MNNVHAFVVYMPTNNINHIKVAPDTNKGNKNMGLYKKIEVDFVARTKENLDYIEQNSIKFPQEITNFLNLCYGLLLFPQQNLDDIIAKMPQELTYYGIDEGDISLSTDKSFSKVVRSMRNGLAHGHLQSLSGEKNDEFVAIAIKDYKNDDDVKNNNPHTIIELSLEKMRKFVITFSDEYVKNKK